jgi:hypothetical protein
MATNKTQTYGDIVATLTSAFDWTWNDYDSGARSDGAFWIAKPQGPNKALRPLGSLCVNHWNDVNNEWAMLLLGDAGTNKESPPLVSPADYKPLWNDAGTGSRHDGSFWRPVPPTGYTALGVVAWGGRAKPPTDLIWCLRNDLVNDAGYRKDQTWDDVSPPFPLTPPISPLPLPPSLCPFPAFHRPRTNIPTLVRLWRQNRCLHLGHYSHHQQQQRKAHPHLCRDLPRL